MVECPNRCGELIELKKPAMIPADVDLVDCAKKYVDMFVPLPGVTRPTMKDIAVCTLIQRVCPACGYVQVKELNEPEFDQYLKETT